MCINQIGGAFGAPLLGTALVVHIDTLAIIERKPIRVSYTGNL